MAVAMFEKKCETLEMLRTIRADIVNFGGMGMDRVYQAHEIMPIPYLDNQNITLPIRTIAAALNLLKEFEEQWQGSK